MQSLILDLLLFINYELLVVVCFFLFIMFILLAEQGSLGSSLQQISHDQRSKLVRALSERSEAGLLLIAYLEKSVASLTRINTNYTQVSNNILLHLQNTTQKIVGIHLSYQVRSYLDNLTLSTQFIWLQILTYFTHELFRKGSYQLSNVPTGVYRICVE